MPKKVSSLTLLAGSMLALTICGEPAKAAKPTPVAVAAPAEGGILWRQPDNISTRDLYFGPGGKAHQPKGPFTFVEEDPDGTTPKYIVRDKDDVKWTVKLGFEARPETTASRFVWAAGYFANEDYFLPVIQVVGVPSHLKRGRKLVGADGKMENVRLKRHLENEKAIGMWRWRDDPFTGTRELNGLRVMMALINNWDLKDVNNKVYTEKDGSEPIYMVSDLGATFGPSGLSFPFRKSRGDLRSYEKSRFIIRTTSEYVDFRTPSRPALIYASSPIAFIRRVGLDKILRHVPRDDARWMGDLLGRLSISQIHDAFRAAGYSTEQINAYSSVIQNRITQLRAL